MDIEINEFHEIIKNLEGGGELSIKEEKYLKIAKLCVQLAAENVALKDINAWCKTDAFKNMYREFKTAEALGCLDVDCMHDAMLVAIMHAPETPATDRIVAGIKADGVEEWVSSRGGRWNGTTEKALKFAKQMREGADK
ncbi:hypothetical protein ACWJ3F_24190 [Klebsiella pneumoniae]|jgi:hypothetical protein